jgi:hypothetical protein
MKLSILAKSSFAIVALIGLFAIIAYTQTQDPKLLDVVLDIAKLVIVGGVLIAALINLPRFFR